tara:strand:- start:9 stop:269 length:261 start_codon:yes stop_codon:yes gene_type:complete
MANVEIYTTVWCPFCHRAKRLLKNKGAEFTEIDVGMSRSKREEMMRRSEGRHTVPQIFIDGISVGGSDELAALDADGKLVTMLGLG